MLPATLGLPVSWPPTSPAATLRFTPQGGSLSVRVPRRCPRLICACAGWAAGLTFPCGVGGKILTVAPVRYALSLCALHDDGVCDRPEAAHRNPQQDCTAVRNLPLGAADRQPAVVALKSHPGMPTLQTIKRRSSMRSLTQSGHHEDGRLESGRGGAEQSAAAAVRRRSRELSPVARHGASATQDGNT
jgi:hypothetical protein